MPFALALAAPSVVAAASSETTPAGPDPTGSSSPTPASYRPAGELPEQLVAHWAGHETAATAQASTFVVGDRIKLTVYELLGSTDSKWINLHGPAQPAQNFYLHDEMSGQYTVGVDGAISLPLLGRFLVSGQTVAGLASELRASFQQALGRRAAINVELTAREPIYVVGPVRRPGSYAYAPALTALHAVALAGGLDEAQGGLQGSLEAVRESGNIRRATERLEQLLARLAVLEAERDGRAPAVPDRLRALAGSAGAASMISEEQAKRAPELELRAEREKSLSMAVDVAGRLLDLARQRVPPTEAAVAMRAERVAALKGLQQRGVFERVVVLQAQSELSDTQNRLVEEQGNVLHAELALQAAREEQLRFVAERKDRLVTDISNMRDQIGDMESGIATSVGVLRALATSSVPAALRDGNEQLSFEIVRQTAAGPRVLEASMTTPLDPGDLVRVRLEGEAATSVDNWGQGPEPRSGWDEAARRATGSR